MKLFDSTFHSHKQSEFIDDDKRAQLIRGNNWVTVFVLAIAVLNIFINVFVNVK